MTTATNEAATAASRLTVQCQFCQTWNRVAADRLEHGPKCGKCGTPMRFDRPWTLTEDSFERTLRESDLPVMVDFYADWCGPCKAMAPAVDALAREYQGRALVAKIDTDRAPRAFTSTRSQGVPTTVVYRQGREVAKQVGAVPKAGLEALLKNAL